MEGKTHIVGGIAAGAGYSVLVGTVDPTTFLLGCTIGSVLPDVDHPQSKLGRVLPFISYPISSLFGHRTFTHSLLFLILASVLFQVVGWPPALETGLLVGIASHILLDFLTKDGVVFLYPLNVDIRFPIGITTGGIIERGVFLALSALVAYYGFEMYL